MEGSRGRLLWIVGGLLGAVALVVGGALLFGGDDGDTGTAPTSTSQSAATQNGGDGGDEVAGLPVVNPDAAERCDRFGYPCTWAEAGDEVLDQSREVGDLMLDQLDGVTLPEGFDAAEAVVLADERVVEAAFDIDGYTAMMVRLEGGLPVYVFTDLARPLRASDAGASALGPVGVIEAERASFEVTRGPAITPRKALVLEPYASVDPASEGNAIVNIIASHPDFQVTYVADAVGPSQLSGWGAFDAVHVSTHGATWCAKKVVVVGGAHFTGEIERGQWDLENCHSGFGAGPLSAIGADWKEGHGLSMVMSKVGGTKHVRLFVSDRYLARQASMSNTVVFLSSCKSGGDRIIGAESPMAGLFGSFVGWDNNVVGSATGRTAREFWRLMAVEGVEFELAVQGLGNLNLDTDAPDRSEVENRLRDLFGATADVPGADTTSMLVTAGSNLRIRDVITTSVGGARLGPDSWIRTDGLIEDGDKDLITEVTFQVEAVRNGDEGTSLIEVILDGDKKLDRKIKVSEGTVVETGDGWQDWEVTVKKLELPFDLTVADVDPADPKDHDWEARVRDGAGNYSARKATPVHFSGGIEAAGPLPIFEQLAAQVAAAGATVEGNELVLRFHSSGGPVTGELHVVLNSNVAGQIGEWDLELTGTHDSKSGLMQGEGSGTAFGQVGDITAGDEGTGTWEATVEMKARKVTGIIGIGDSSQSFVATFR